MAVFSVHITASDTILIPVKLQLKWKHQFQFAGYYAAIEKGYYKDVGLKVELIEASEAKIPADEVINGNADFGISASDVVLMRSEGKPVVVLATIFQHSAQVLLATESSGITHVHDLVGKRLMIEPHSADLIAYMNDEGIALERVEIISHNFDVNMLVNNQIDAMTAYITDEPFVLQESNIAYDIISPISGGIDFYGDVLITTEKLLREKPLVVKKFREASLKGWDYAMENPDEIVELIYNTYSNRHSKKHLSFEANKMKNLIEADIVEIGYSNSGRWRRIIEIYKQTRMLSNEASIEGLLYTDYLEIETIIPWKLVAIFSLVVLFFGSIALFFYRLSNKLKLEIIHSKEIQQSLSQSKKELEITNKKITQLSNFKEDMTNMIIHDLKSPLNAIINVKQFKDKKLGINLIQQSGYKMLNLVKNILDVYRYENTKIDLIKGKVLLNDIIEKAIEEIDFSANRRAIKIERPKGLNCLLEVDEEIIRRVFVNLLSNGVKFSPKEGTIKIEASIKKNDLLKVIISNEGEGIPVEMQNLIFDRFGQVEHQIQSEQHSSGLGLAFCKMAIEAHGGAIGVVSEAEIGVEFWFTLPDVVCVGVNKAEV